MRKFAPNDAPGIARLIHALWPDNNPDPARIARVSLETKHVTLVESDGDQLVSFVSAFPTIALDGRLRWEVDLLGVHPDYRSRGIAQALVGEVVEAGCLAGAQSARALVRIDNQASRNTFLRCGFTLDDTICDLFVSDQVVDDVVVVPLNVHLIPVETLTYGGIWIEGEFSLPALRCGAAERSRAGLDIAGAVIPAGILDAEQAGYERVGQYRWLWL